MKRFIRILAYLVTIASVLLSLAYILLLAASSLISLPFEIAPNVFVRDWYFMAIPILALLSGVLLQIASLKKAKKHRDN